MKDFSRSAKAEYRRLSHVYLTVEKPAKIQLKSIPLQWVLTRLFAGKETTKHAGRGDQSPDHIIIF
jgi:hypothetical protein